MISCAVIVDTPSRQDGAVTRDGVTVHYQVFGNGPRTILLLPTWSIVHSDFWRHQVPHLARRHTVVTFDGRGNGASDRPMDPAAYADDEFAADGLAILDVLGVEQATIASISAGAAWALLLAAQHPERVPASIFIAPSVPLTPPLPERAAAFAVFDQPQERYDGWLKFNRHYWQIDWPDFLRFFFSQCFTEPDSQEQIDHFVGMGLQTTADAITATVDAPGLDGDATADLAASITRPVLAIHGDCDAVTADSKARELARLTRGELVILPGSGHEPQARIPGRVNQLFDEFLAAHP
jgi:pimeloyl-ACP methyl ester carboxylesterase